MECKRQVVLICMVVLYQVENWLTVISLGSILYLYNCSILVLSLSICTTLSSSIFSATPYITCFFPIRLESVLAWFGVGGLLIVVDKLLCFDVFCRETLISFSIDEKSLIVQWTAIK